MIFDFTYNGTIAGVVHVTADNYEAAERNFHEQLDADLDQIGAEMQCLSFQMRESSNHIKHAVFVTYLAHGVVVRAPCTVNLITKEVYDIAAHPCDEYGFCESEAIEIDGKLHPVYPWGDAKPGQFKY